MPNPPQFQGYTSDRSVPPNALPGDLMIALFRFRDGYSPNQPWDETEGSPGTSPSVPGFTKAFSQRITGDHQADCAYLECYQSRDHWQYHVWWKRLTAADTGSYSFSISDDQDAIGTVKILHFKNVKDTGSPFDATDGDALYVWHPAESVNSSYDTGSTQSPIVGPLTTVGPQRLILFTATWSGTATGPSGFTLAASGSQAWTKVQEVAGSTGNLRATSTADTNWGVWAAAIASLDKVVTLTTSIAAPSGPATTTALQKGVARVSPFSLTAPDAPAGPTVRGRNTLTAGSIAAPATPPTPGLSAGAVTLGATSVPSPAAVPVPTVRLRIGAHSVPVTEAVGSPAALIGDVTVPSIGSGERFGTATMSPGAVSLTVPAIGTAQAFGAAKVQLSIAPPDVASVAAFGTATLLPGAAIVTAQSAPSAAAVPSPWLQTQVIRVPSFVTEFTQLLGEPQVLLRVVVDDGIPGDDHIQSGPELLLGTARTFPSPISTRESVPIDLLLHLSIDPTVRPAGSSIATATGVRYEVIMVARIPQQSGPPTLLTVDAIDWLTIEWTNILNRPQELEMTCLIGGLTDPVLQRLRAPERLATELHVVRDGATVFAGPLFGGQKRGEQLTLTARGLMAYLRLMVISDKDMWWPTTSDQHMILRGMIDECQTKPYGHFGIDTFDVLPSGMLRKAFWKMKELHNVADRVEDLVDSDEQNNGFDVDIDPATRRLQCWTPQRGTDRSHGDGAVVFDARNITSDDVMFSVSPEDIASHVIGTGSDPDKPEVTFIAQAFNNQLLATYGRATYAESWGTEAPDQATLQRFVNRELDNRDQALWVPGPDVRIDPDSDPGQYDVGDYVWFDAGGRIGVSGKFRVKERMIKVDDAGRETGSLQFA